MPLVKALGEADAKEMYKLIKDISVTLHWPPFRLHKHIQKWYLGAETQTGVVAFYSLTEEQATGFLEEMQMRLELGELATDKLHSPDEVADLWISKKENAVAQ